MAADPELGVFDRVEETATGERTTDRSDRAPVAPSGPAPGTNVGGYVVLGRIGEGGMGVVYAARDADLDRTVALKFLDGTRSRPGGPHELRLLREAQAMARLSHPNVVAIYDVGTFEERVFFAMEFVDGVDLRRWLKEETRTPDEILAVFRGAGSGLAAAHAAGIIHRDFKPGNILVDREGRPRVTDFGISRALRASGEMDAERPGPGDDLTAEDSAPTSSNLLAAALTRTGVVHGTPSYMAPEQHRGGPPDARSDQFSFCVALYEALYREHPFPGARSAALLDDVLAGRIRKPPRSNVPGWCRRALLRGLRPVPESRFPSMEALLAALEPPTATRRAIAVGLGGAALAVLVATLAGGREPDEDRCTGGRAQLAQVWDANRAQAVQTAFAATERAHARSSADRAIAQLDAYGRDWTAMHRAACRATVRGEQSSDLLDRRMACLNRHLSQVEGMVDLFVHRADGELVDAAIRAVEGLEPVATCDGSTSLASRVAPPPEATRPQVTDLERRIDRAELERLAGHPEAAATAARVVLDAEPAVAYPPLAAQAGRVLGRSLQDLGRPVEARDALIRAQQMAERAGDRRLTAHIMLDLLTVIGVQQDRYGEADLLGRLIEATLERAELRDDQEVRARLLQGLGSVAAAERRRDRAIDLAREALELRRRTHPPVSAEVADAESSLGSALTGAARFDEARPHLLEALAIHRSLYGDDHPATAVIHTNIGLMNAQDGEVAEGRKHFGAALAIFERVPEHRTYPSCLSGLGSLESDAGNYELARTYHERSMAVLLERVGPDHPDVARNYHNLGIIALVTDHPDHALELYSRSLAIEEKSLGKDHPRYGLTLALAGEAHRRLGRAARSLADQDHALAIIGSRMADHPTLGYPLTYKALALADLGRRREAIQVFERALEKLRPGDGDRGMAAFGLARALDPRRPRSARARALAEEALRIFTDVNYRSGREQVAAYLGRAATN
jgi:tetratricopeptide (TPR) repeat protein